MIGCDGGKLNGSHTKDSENDEKASLKSITPDNADIATVEHTQFETTNATDAFRNILGHGLVGAICWTTYEASGHNVKAWRHFPVCNPKTCHKSAVVTFCPQNLYCECFLASMTIFIILFWLNFSFLVWRTTQRRERLSYASSASVMALIGSAMGRIEITMTVIIVLPAALNISMTLYLLGVKALR